MIELACWELRFRADPSGVRVVHVSEPTAPVALSWEDFEELSQELRKRREPVSPHQLALPLPW